MMSKLLGLLRLYTKNILISLDQFLSVVLGGDPDETVSSRVGKWSNTGNPVGKILERILDALFGKNHCQDCIERDEGKNRII